MTESVSTLYVLAPGPVFRPHAAASLIERSSSLMRSLSSHNGEEVAGEHEGCSGAPVLSPWLTLLHRVSEM